MDATKSIPKEILGPEPKVTTDDAGTYVSDRSIV